MVIQALLTIEVVAISFLATNLENQFILLAYLHHPQYSTRTISTGYVSAIGLILLASYGFSQQVAQIIPDGSVRYLGFLPIFLGAWEALMLLLKPKSMRSEMELQSRETQGGKGVVAVGATTLASGGDSLVVFTSLFSDTQHWSDLVILATGLGMAILWVALARWLSGHAWISTRLHQFGRFLVPLLLVAVGLFILTDTPVDVD